ncbi:MAG TPA: phosphoribosylanthranilate isomerase [Abditibacteriaceae bacterium]|jgi:phosphoribosylanthranilate isomerase
MPHSTLVKICGTTTLADALLARDAVADYLGAIVEYPPSPRHISVEDAREIFRLELPVVAVTVNQTLDTLLRIARELQPAALQLHGDESPELVRALKAEGLTVWAACSGEPEAVRKRALVMTAAGADAVLLDARAVSNGEIIYGGTGHRADWNLARELVEEGLRVILAGGLNPESVADAIDFVRPWMVDVASGVEARKGVKDAAKVTQFIKNVR